MAAFQQRQYVTVDVREADALLKDRGYKYLDVRTPEEHREGHVPGAVNIPVWFKAGEGMQPNPKFLEQVKGQFPDKNVMLVVGCKSGKRSTAACLLMDEAGYKEVSNMMPGFDGWLEENMPVEK